MKLSTVALTLLGVVAAVCASLLVASLVSKPKAAPSVVASAPATETAIVVAARDLVPLTTLLPEHLRLQTVPIDRAGGDSLNGIEQAVGRMVRTRVVAGQAISKDILVNSGAGAVLASGLPTGMRAVTVSMAGADALEGHVYPGSMVDVVATFRSAGRLTEPVSTVLLQKVLVLAVDSQTTLTAEPESGPKKDVAPPGWLGRKITLMVSASEAQKLELATGNGTLSLLMRRPDDPTISAAVPQGLAALAGLTKPPAPKAPPSSVEPPLPTTQKAPVIKPPEPVRPEEPAPPRTWRTEIIRGDTRNTQTFEIPPTGGK